MIRLRSRVNRLGRGGENWRQTLFVTAVAQAFSILGFSFVTPFLPLYIQTLGVHGIASVTFWAAMLSGLVAIPMAITAPIWGVLADRYGRKIMVVRAAGSAAVLIALMAAATNVYQLLALRLLQGVFTGTVSASQALVASQTPRKRLGFSLGVMQTAVFVGTSMGPLLGGIAAQVLGFRPTFFIAGGCLLTCAVMVGVFVKEERPDLGTAERSPIRLIGGMKDVLTIAAFLPLVASIFAVQFAMSQVIPILPQFIQLLQGASGHAAIATGVILAAAGGAAAASSTVTGAVSDRIGHKRVLAYAALAGCIIAVPQFFVTDTWQLGVLRVIDGLALGAMLPTASAIMAGLVPAERRGAAYGLSGAFTSMGFAAGPLTAAAIVALTGIRAVFLSAAALLLLISIWVALMVPSDQGEVHGQETALREAAE